MGWEGGSNGEGGDRDEEFVSICVGEGGGGWVEMREVGDGRLAGMGMARYSGWHITSQRGRQDRK